MARIHSKWKPEVGIVCNCVLYYQLQVVYFGRITFITNTLCKLDLETVKFAGLELIKVSKCRGYFKGDIEVNYIDFLKL